MGSMLAVGTLGLCAVAVWSVATLVRMDMQRTASSANEAQALALLRAGADVAWERLVDGSWDAVPVEDAWPVPLPTVLGDRGDVAMTLRLESLAVERDQRAVTVHVEANVGKTFAKQRLVFTRDTPDTAWLVSSSTLLRIYSAR